MTDVTILGATGFIGSRLAAKLQSQGHPCYCPDRDEDLLFKGLGCVIYCIGLTADFRNKPFETVDAHVTKLLHVLRNCKFERLIYLSSTRLYAPEVSTAKETDSLRIDPLNPDDLYNISKALGESMAIACGRDVRIARLSNVYGPDFRSNNFLSSILRDAIGTRKISLRTSLDSSKDYVSIDDVTDLLVNVAFHGRNRVYNIASGVNVTNMELVTRIKTITGCDVEVRKDAESTIYPQIDTTTIKEEFGFRARSVIDDLPGLIGMYNSRGACEFDNN